MPRRAPPRRPAPPVVVDVESPSPAPDPLPVRAPVAPPVVSASGVVVPIPPEAARVLERYAEIGAELHTLGRAMLAAASSFVGALQGARAEVERDTRALRRRRGRRRTR